MCGFVRPDLTGHTISAVSEALEFIGQLFLFPHTESRAQRTLPVGFRRQQQIVGNGERKQANIPAEKVRDPLPLGIFHLAEGFVPVAFDKICQCSIEFAGEDIIGFDVQAGHTHAFRAKIAGRSAHLGAVQVSYAGNGSETLARQLAGAPNAEIESAAESAAEVAGEGEGVVDMVAVAREVAGEGLSKFLNRLR